MTIYRSQNTLGGFEFDTATRVIKDYRGKTATLSAHAAVSLAFTLDLLEKYESTYVGSRAMFDAMQFAWSFYED